jgi:4-hydroxybenzoate polyprenyltransferase
MKKTEIGLIAIGFLGLIFKLLHLPGGALFILVPFIILALTYMYLGFALFNGIKFRKIFKKDSYHNIKTPRIIGAIGTGLALNCSIFGIIFRFLNYPGASYLLLFGLVCTSIITIISIQKKQKDTEQYYVNILKRIAVFGTLCLVLVVMPYRTWLKINHPKNPEYIEAVMKSRANPDDPELRKKVSEEWEKMINEYK